MLIYRSTPLACGKTPTQLLMGRNVRSNLPTTRQSLKINPNNGARDFKAEKQRQKQDFDKKVKPVSELAIGTKVCLYDKQKKVWSNTGKVVEKVAPRSYLVRSKHGVLYRRNIMHLRPIGLGTLSNSKLNPRNYDDDDFEPMEGSPDQSNFANLYNLRPRRNIRAPQRLITSI